MHLNINQTTNNYWYANFTETELDEFSKTQPELFNKFIKKNYNGEWGVGIYTAAGFYNNFGNIPFKYATTTIYNCGIFNTIIINGKTYNSNSTSTVLGNTLFKLNDKVSKVRTITIVEVNNILNRPHSYYDSLNELCYNDLQTSIDEGKCNTTNYRRSLIELDYLCKAIAQFNKFTNYDEGKYFLASPYQQGSGSSRLGCDWIYTHNGSSGGFNSAYNSAWGIRPVIEFENIEWKISWSESDNCWIMSE